MRSTLFLLIAVTSAVAAQDLVDTTESDWMSVPFEERERRFETEDRDLDWAPSMEQAIADEIAAWQRPPVRLVSAECRETLCKIDMHWPRNSGLPKIGGQLSRLYGLGIDHQGEFDGDYENNRYRLTAIAQRRD